MESEAGGRLPRPVTTNVCHCMATTYLTTVRRPTTLDPPGSLTW